MDTDYTNDYGVEWVPSRVELLHFTNNNNAWEVPPSSCDSSRGGGCLPHDSGAAPPVVMRADDAGEEENSIRYHLSSHPARPLFNETEWRKFALMCCCRSLDDKHANERKRNNEKHSPRENDSEMPWNAQTGAESNDATSEAK